jgi:hypothetical protein
MGKDILTFDPFPERTEKGYIEFSSPSSKQASLAEYSYIINEKIYGRIVDAHPILL